MHQHFLNRSEPCPAFACSRQRGLNFCYECDDFPCEHLQPYADRAGKLPHNTKVFNLCLIKKMGLEQWAEQMADKVRQAYFHKPWSHVSRPPAAQTLARTIARKGDALGPSPVVY